MRTIVMSVKNVEVSFVIPCLNEADVLSVAIGFAQEAVELLQIPCEIVVSDNGSTDGSIEIAKQLGARVVHAEGKGYGNALMSGFSQAYGKYIVMGDADGTYDFREAVLFIEKLREGNVDFVIGSRLKGNIEKDANPFLHRYLGTPVLSFLIRKLFDINISDCNCGMRAFSKEAYERLGLTCPGMEFASEMLIKSGLLKLRVVEIPCSLYKDRRNRPAHLNTWRDGWRHLKLILAFYFRGK
jgi:glycosyltransferase involved in cell wall biosynthesis